MVAATLHDIVRRYKQADFGSKHAVRKSFDSFPDKVGIKGDSKFWHFSKFTIVISL